MFAVAMAVALVVSAAPAAPEPPWELVQKGEITVYARKTPGSNVAEVRATMSMHATPAQIRAVLLDDDRAAHGSHMVEYREIAHPAPNVWVHYGRMSFPLIDDRDYFVQATLDPDLAPDGSGRFKLSWQPWGLDRPSRFHVVRVRTVQGYWDVRPAPGGAQVEFDLLCDPGGSVPGWLVDRLNRSEIPEMLRGVERDAQRQGLARK